LKRVVVASGPHDHHGRVLFLLVFSIFNTTILKENSLVVGHKLIAKSESKNEEC